ncbi:MAG: carbohydrate kinase family protein [Hyphomicrobium sp.]|jgi:ribokinase
MKAITIGGATIDTIAIIDSAHIERMSMRNAESSFLLLEEGQKTEALEVAAHCGGGAANAAVAFARLGFETAALVKLGEDQRAKAILERFASEGISSAFVRRDPKRPTGASVLISSHERDAAIFTFRGANTSLEEADFSDDAFARDLVYVSNLSNRSAECFPGILARAKAKGALIAANPGVRQLAAYTEAFIKGLPEIHILTLNRAEAAVLVAPLARAFGEGDPLPSTPSVNGWSHDNEAMPRLARRGLSGGGFAMSLKAFFAAILKIGTQTAVITDGDQGAYAARGNEIHYCPATATRDIAGTAGAGDAFASTFAAFAADSNTIDVALRAASLNAASVLTHVDTQSGLLPLAAILSRLEESRGQPNGLCWRL